MGSVQPPHKGDYTMALAKDKAKLAVAAVKSEDTQDLYVAVTKATLPDEVVPKEKHVRTLRIACSVHSPRTTVDFVIYKLAKRVNNPSWIVALKALMTFHRLLRECDASFAEQVVNFADRTGRRHLLGLERFADHTGRESWDYSAWVRVYSSYLDERIGAFRSMRFDPEGNTATAHQHAAQQQQQQGGYGGAAGNPYTQNGAAAYGGAPPGGAFGSPNGATNGNYSNGGLYGGQTGAPYGGQTGAPYGGQTGAPYGGQTGGPYGGPTGPYGGPTGAYGGGATGGGHAAASPIKLKDCSTPELLQHLPTIQKLLGRLMQCVPEGASAINPVILTSCSWVLKESRAVYKAASEGIMNLADKFFEMERAQALQGIELYKENLALGDRLTAYYAAMQSVPALQHIINFPQLAPLPADFLTAMEEYVREAPKEVDPSLAGGGRGHGPVTGNRVSNMAARGGATSAALSPPPGDRALSPTESESAAAAEAAAAAAAAEEEAAKARAAAAAAAAAAASRQIDLLSFDDDPVPAPAAAVPAAPAPKSELDFLADGMYQQPGQQQQQQVDSFGEQPAFGAPEGNMTGMPPPGYGYQGYPPNPYGGYGPYAGPTGMDPYAAAGYGQPNPFGPYAGPTGAPQNMALVPVGMNPMLMGGAIVPYGMGPFGGMAPMAGPTGGLNPFNPFLATAPPGSQPPPLNEGPVRMANDPLNELTDQLLGPPKAKGEVAKQPTLNQIKQSRLSERQIPDNSSGPPTPAPAAPAVHGSS